MLNVTFFQESERRLPLGGGVVAVAAHVGLGHRLGGLAVQEPRQPPLVVLIARVLLRGEDTSPVNDRDGSV